MFADTIVLPLSTGNVTVTKVNQDNFGSVYRFRDATHGFQLRIRHSVSNRNGVTYDRHNFELIETIYAAGAVPEYSRTDYFVAERLQNDVNYVNTDGIADYFIASSNASLVKLFNGES